MRVMENGVCRDMTAEEIAEFQQQEAQPTEPSLEERLAQLEALLAERGLK